MAKFDPEEWKKRMASEAADEHAAQASRDAKMDAAFEKEWGEFFGMDSGKMRELLDNAVPDQTKAERDASFAAMKKARKAWARGDSARAEKIVMGTRGIREAKKAKSGKGCLVVGAMILSSATLSIWGMVEGARALLG